MKNLIQIPFFLIIVPVFFFQQLFAMDEGQKEWLKWKEKIEKSYEKKFSSPTYTHHIYLKKSGDKAFIDLNFKYPRFVKSECEKCEWSLIRNSGNSIVVKGRKKQFNLPLEKEILIDGEKDKYLSAYKDDKSNEIRVFIHDLGQKSLEKKRKRILFPYKKEFVYESQFYWLSSPRNAKIQRSDGSTKVMPIVAEIKFKINKKNHSLSIYDYEEEDFKSQDVLMLLYRDSSNGKMTYGAGRFLNLKLPKKLGLLKNGDRVTLDFNYSYNPPCAVSTGFHCPLPQDFVKKEVLAGEKYSKK